MFRIRPTGTCAQCQIVIAIFVCALVLLPASVQARGVIWLHTKRAAAAPLLLHPSLATYRNHAYILSVHEIGSNAATSVYLTTNETKHWKTTLLSARGPEAAYSQEFVTLAIDPSKNTLYAAWVYRKDAQHVALGVWTRVNAGAWAGPVDIAIAGNIVGDPSVVAGNGNVFVSFASPPGNFPGTCDDHTSHALDVVVINNMGGSGWGRPQNLSSCATDTETTSLSDPKLAIDETGKAYLVSRAGSVEGNLWYADEAGGTWTQASRLTTGVKVPDYASSPALRTLYGISASRDTVYVAFTTGIKGGSVQLLVRSAGKVTGPTRISPADKEGCPQFGVALAARAGRVLVSYIRAASGYCAVVSAKNEFNGLHLLAGSASRLTSVSPGLPHAASCGDSALSSDGDVFRLVANCGSGLLQLAGSLYYKKEFLDVVGPNTHLVAPHGAGSGRVVLRWTARDATPGSGVWYFQVQAKSAGTHWLTVANKTRARSLTLSIKPHRLYTFRVRARDRVNNWGKWISTTYK